MFDPSVDSPNAQELLSCLQRLNQRIVFAESCTAGLVAATVATIAGASQWLCGSSVTYRREVKEAWLEIDSGLIDTHTAVSAEVTEAMAHAVLMKTPDADLSLAITGHLESGKTEDGPLMFVAIGRRQDTTITCCPASRIQLLQSSRIARQREAVVNALQCAVRYLNADSKTD